MRKLTKNAICCLTCGDIIESKTVHDFQTCRCGKVLVDGDCGYAKRISPPGVPSEWYEDLYEWKEL
ncbi:hypothetical protein FE783_00050 [Paenibacillus mesophilus]|nr:hypothetical protein FE783_00050 [Paenibacillus mesophilus]